MPLNKGTIGAESARLLGSLIVGLTWTLALSRANIPAYKRHIISLYIDELQDYLALPTDLSDALAQARGLGVGITMAHQYRAQLPPDIRAGIDANARSKIVFGLNATDAKEVAAMAPELDVLDFMTLLLYLSKRVMNTMIFMTNNGKEEICGLKEQLAFRPVLPVNLLPYTTGSNIIKTQANTELTTVASQK